MSKQEKLDRVVATLRNDAAALGRTLLAENADALLAAVLAECDATVLDRQLCFNNEKNEKIFLTLANRRLFSVDCQIAKARTFEDLSLDDKKQVAALQKAMTSFVSSSKALIIRSQTLGKPAGAGRVGIPVATLAALWGIDTDAALEPKQHGGAEVFAEMIQPHVLSCVIVENGNVVLSFGEAEPAEKLSGFALNENIKLEMFLDANFEMGNATKRISILATQPEDGFALVCAKAHTSTLLAIVKEGAVADVMSQWQSF